MKPNALKTGLVILMVSLSPTLLAANFQVPWTRTITEIRTYDGYAAVRYTPSVANGLGCAGGTTANEYAIIDWRTKPENKTLYTAALSAFLLKKKVGMGITNTPACFSAYGSGVPLVYRLDMK